MYTAMASLPSQFRERDLNARLKPAKQARGTTHQRTSPFHYGKSDHNASGGGGGALQFMNAGEVASWR